jgi:hypothetical protein
MRAAGRIALAALLLLPLAASAQEAAAPPPAAEEKTGWEFNASVYGYFVPDEKDYGQPTVTADRGALHLEARYNYEGIDTGSAWVGWNFGFGKTLRFDATVMAGGVFGDTKGVAPGFHLTISLGRFELYSEGEYVVDVEDSSNNYFYNWTQLGFSVCDWLSVGFVEQRTRAYQTDLDVQRGLFVGVTWSSWTLTVNVFNLGWESPTVAAALAFSF